MRAFSIFDDFPESSISILRKKGVEVDVLPKGQERPSGLELEALLSEYDILFISTAQVIPEELFLGINSPRIIGTASSGVDHIHIPSNKSDLIKVVNAAEANRITVAEHIFALILTLSKNLIEGRKIALAGKTKKELASLPKDLVGSTIGVVGAGSIAGTVLKMASSFGMKRLCWTPHPDSHNDLKSDGVFFVNIDELIHNSDIVSISIPLSKLTTNLINSDRISLLKEDAVFVSTSRSEVV